MALTNRTEMPVLEIPAGSVTASAGDEIGRAIYCPEDEDFLFDRQLTVTHFDVA